MVKREAELSRQLNEQMKGGTGTTEVIRVLDAGEYESGLKLIAKPVSDTHLDVYKRQVIPGGEWYNAQEYEEGPA